MEGLSIGASCDAGAAHDGVDVGVVCNADAAGAASKATATSAVCVVISTGAVCVVAIVCMSVVTDVETICVGSWRDLCECCCWCC